MDVKRFGALNLLLMLTLACCIVRLWAMPLRSSLWVDEMGTYFVVHHGADDPTLRAAPQVAQSIYYALPKLAERVAGFSEVSYRFFSLLAMLGALAAVGWLAARLIHPDAAWFAVFACLTSRGFNYQAADARPYGLGTFVLALAIVLEVRWFDSGRRRDGLLFAVAASVLWWVHLVFWPLYLIFAFYAVFRIARRETSVGWGQGIAMFALIACAVVPVALRAVSLLRQASAHVVVPPPRMADLLLILKVKAVALTAAGAFLLSRIFKWKPARAAWVSGSSAALILGWWLIDPVTLFAFSRLSGNSIFVTRYLYLALPGVILTAGTVTAMFVPARYWKPVALALGLGVLISMGHWKTLWPEHHPSDWRGAANALREWSSGQAMPVICPSPFIEAQVPVWRPDYPEDGFLYSNLGIYRVAGHVYPFPFTAPPFSTPAEVADYARSLAASTLAPAGRFAIYGGDVAVEYWRKWFAAQPELRGWGNKRLGKFGDVEVVGFARTL